MNQKLKEHRVFSFDKFVLDLDRGALLRGEEDVPLRPKCFEVLSYLVIRNGELVTKGELMAAVWTDVVVTDDSLTQCLIQIRRALGDTKKEMIRTMPRRGFLFDIPVTIYQPGEIPGPKTAHRPFLDNRRPSSWSVGAAIILALAIVATWWDSERHDAEMGSLNGENLVNVRTQDAEANKQHLKAKFFYSRRAPGDIERAIKHYRHALDIDSGMADAWVGLAGSIRLQSFNGEIPWEQGFSKMKAMLDKALELDPDNAELHIRLAQYYRNTLDKENGQLHLDRALRLGQNNALVLSVASSVALSKGHIDKAIEYQRRAAALDPLGFVNHGNLGQMLYAGGLYDEAREAMSYASSLNPESSDEHNWLIGLSWILQQQCAEAEVMMQKLPEGNRRDQGMAMIYYVRSEQAKLDAAIESLQTGSGFDSAFYLAEIFAFQGEVDESFRWLNEATDKILNADPQLRNSSDYRMMERSPFLKSMHDDSRWAEWQINTEKRVTQNRS